MPQFFFGIGQWSGVPQPWIPVGAVQSFQQRDRGLELDCNGPRVVISVLAPNLIRVRFSPSGVFLPRRSWAVTKDDSEWSAVEMVLEEKAEAIAVKTEQLTLSIQRNPYRLVWRDRQNRLITQDSEPALIWSTNGISARQQIADEEHFYGFGERTGFLDKRAEQKTNWTTNARDYGPLTDEMYQAIPFFISVRPDLCYGIFLNSTFWSQFDLGSSQPDTWSMQTCAPELDYYLIYGSEPAQILATYTELTGRMPMPPKWALGYHQCRWSYNSEAVVREVAQEFRQRRIPCDVIHLDIDYMQGYRVFTWSQKRFPNPKELMSELKDSGFHTVAIVDPGVKYEREADYTVFDQGIERDYFIREADGNLFYGYVWPEKSFFPDFLRPEVRQWWSQQHSNLTDVGVAGIWNDMNEPALDDRPFGDHGNLISFPLDAPQGSVAERTTHAEAHNLYGSNMAQASYEALHQLRPGQRSFVLTRSGFAGIQRWATVWTGDNQSQWQHLEMSLPMLCNLGLSGVPFVGCDIGGFDGNATAELFARWMQVGVLYPFMRGHSALSTAPHEPWAFGDRVERICREYIELRYRLLPYLYTLFWEASTTGAPILRPLLYHYPSDPQTYQLHDQVLLGPALMAAPVYRPGVQYRAVYLPEGIWYDWWTQERYQGPTHILAHAPLERMPLYIKAGAIIPMQQVVQYVGQQPITELTLKLAPGNGEWTLYEDDGDTLDYQSGAWSTVTYQVKQEGKQVRLTAKPRQGNWQPPERTLRVELVQANEGLTLLTELEDP